MIKNLLFILLPFVAIRLPFILAITGYRLWHLWMDVPIVALMSAGAWLKTRQEREHREAVEALKDRLRAIRETQEEA